MDNKQCTIKFRVPGDEKEDMHTILRGVFDALNEKGYNPINQIVGYLLTEDPPISPTTIMHEAIFVRSTVMNFCRSWFAAICLKTPNSDGRLLPPQRPTDFHFLRRSLCPKD